MTKKTQYPFITYCRPDAPNAVQSKLMPPSMEICENGVRLKITSRSAVKIQLPSGLHEMGTMIYLTLLFVRGAHTCDVVRPW